MEKKVLLIFPPPKNRTMYINTLPPIGLLGIASFLIKKGIKCEVVDGNVMAIPKDFKAYSDVCISVNVSNIENTKNLISQIRKSNFESSIIIGGPMDKAKGLNLFKILRPDIVIIGEGEYALYEFLTAEDRLSIKGLILEEKGRPYFTGEPGKQPDLDELPIAALDKVPIKKYNLAIKRALPVSSIITSRGCPNDCIFCYHDKLWRQRSAKNVVDEIAWQVNYLGVREIAIMDDNFTLNRKRVMEICDLIIKRKIKVWIQLNNGVRADKIDFEMLRKLKQAGLWFMGIAPEVGGQESLAKIKKGFKHRDVENAVYWSKKLSISTMAYFTLGYPWETKDDIIETIDYAIKLNPDMVQFTRVTPIEGTPLYDMVSKSEKSVTDDKSFFTNSQKYELRNIDEKDMGLLVRKAYREFYFRPRKLISLATRFKLLDLIGLGIYAIRLKTV